MMFTGGSVGLWQEWSLGCGGGLQSYKEREDSKGQSCPSSLISSLAHPTSSLSPLNSISDPKAQDLGASQEETLYGGL